MTAVEQATEQDAIPVDCSIIGELLLQKEFATAESMAAAGLRDADENSAEYRQLLLHHGAALQGLGRIDDAARIFATAIELDHDDPEPLTAMAGLFLSLGRLDEAALFQGQAMKADPGNVSGFLQLAKIFRLMDKPDVVTELLQAAELLEPDSVEIATLLMVHLARRRDFATAIAVGERVQAIHPTDTVLLNHLGMIHDAAGNVEKAWAYYKSVLAIRPDDGVATHRLNSLTGNAAETVGVGYLLETFGAEAETFEELLVNRLRYRIPGLFHRRLAMLARNRKLRILDIGCGTGLCGLVARDFASHLTGVDVVPAMIRLAEEKAIYDELITGEMVEVLNSRTDSFDVVMAGDVLLYVGNINPVLQAAWSRLVPGGHLLVSSERADAGVDFAIQRNGRYKQGKEAVRRRAVECGFEVVEIADESLRLELGRPVRGMICLLKRPAEQPPAL